MKWLNEGPKLTEADIQAFEHRIGEGVPNEVRWFLTNVVNGGYPEKEHFVRFRGEVEGEGETPVHTICGMNHPDPNYSLKNILECVPLERKGLVWPLGADDWGSPFVLILVGPRKGQIGIIARSKYFYEVSPPTLSVAQDIFKFAELLNGPSAVERDPSLRTPPGFELHRKSDWRI